MKMEIFVGINIANKTNEYLSLSNIDFQRDVLYLKKVIAEKIDYDAKDIEIVYNGCALDDNQQLGDIMRPSATVHCFRKTKKYEPYHPTEAATVATAMVQVQELFKVTAHIQINVHSRVNILQKILAEYPEFRRNLGAQALIRDSVLFNTLHQPEVINNIADHYPIICEAAAFIVDTIKKELTRNASNSNFSEPATDSTNSSEEESSIGGSSGSGATTGDAESARIRLISRQQLQTALQQIGLGSANSLSNIAQRNSDTSSDTSTATQLSSSASGERISSTQFRNELQRALRSVRQLPSASTVYSEADPLQQMDASEITVQNSSEESIDDGDIPSRYRLHQYSEQLRTMAQMGFTNHEENMTFLNITNGNIENAINLIMGSMN